MQSKKMLVLIEDEGEQRALLLGKQFAQYNRVDLHTLPHSVLEKIALLKLTPVNKLENKGLGRRLHDFHTTVYLSDEEHKEIDNARKESEGQGSKATEGI